MIEQDNVSTNFATLVSLIGQFKHEKLDNKNTDLECFQQWLVSNDHYDVLTVLKGNVKAINGIKNILEEDKQITIAKLNRLNTAISAFATTVKGFDQISLALNPNIILSESSKQALKKFDQNEFSLFTNHGEVSGPSSIDLEDLAEPIATSKEIISDEDLLILDY